MEVSGQPHASAAVPWRWDNPLYPQNERLVVGSHSRSVRFREETSPAASVNRTCLSYRLFRHFEERRTVYCTRARVLERFFYCGMYYQPSAVETTVKRPRESTRLLSQ